MHSVLQQFVYTLYFVLKKTAKQTLKSVSVCIEWLVDGEVCNVCIQTLRGCILKRKVSQGSKKPANTPGVCLSSFCSTCCDLGWTFILQPCHQHVPSPQLHNGGQLCQISWMEMSDFNTNGVAGRKWPGPTFGQAFGLCSTVLIRQGYPNKDVSG